MNMRSACLMMKYALLVAAVGASASTYQFTDVELDAGLPTALHTKVMTNTITGEMLQVVVDSGGKTAKLQLRSPATGKLRDVLVPLTDASAIRDTINGTHFAGSVLVPYANRIANGTYSFFGKRMHLDRNECNALRCGALHGFLFNRSLSVVSQQAWKDDGVDYARLTLGYNFTGEERDTPGWPFECSVRIDYTLQTNIHGRTTFALTISATKYPVQRLLQPRTSRGPLSSPFARSSVLCSSFTAGSTATDGGALPWTASWHPYFRVADVSQTKMQFDTCGTSPAMGWRHMIMTTGAPRKGTLIPTGYSEPWTTFDGVTPIGGTATKPTYFDDEFKATLPLHVGDEAVCGTITQRIIDGNETTTLTAGATTWQVFTGAKEGWGWDAIALEPMRGAADAFNNGDGLTVLEPGEQFASQFVVALEKHHI